MGICSDIVTCRTFNAFHYSYGQWFVMDIDMAQSPSHDRRTGALKSRELRLRQSKKIAELRQKLMAAGLLRLEQQASALGLSRSTAWTVLKGRHKSSGLSAKIIVRILNSKGLPRGVRTTLIEYIEEKCAGKYGHKQKQIARFRAQLGEPAKRELSHHHAGASAHAA